MFDLMALAWEADLTRVFSFMLNREASQLVFPNLGFNEPWHHVSHHGNEAEKLALLVKLNTWQIEVFGRFLDRLRKTPDGDGNLLDNSLILYGSPMADSNIHNHRRAPLFLAGHAGGRLKGGVHVKAADGTPMANSMLTMLHMLGRDDLKQFGDSTGELDLNNAAPVAATDAASKQG